MIELGSISVHDHESLVLARSKTLGVVLQLGGSEVRATLAATALSETVRAGLHSGRPVVLNYDIIERSGRGVLRITLSARSSSSAVPSGCFDRVLETDPGNDTTLQLELDLPHAHTTTTAALARVRARLSSKSRSELMEELQRTNRQLEEYNDSLEATVAERTVELRLTNDRMKRDLDAGAAYVRALIPDPVVGELSIDWRYIPSANLGGDTIGYHWVDDDHLVLYLVDVTGHGLDSALLAVSVTNLIRSGSLNADMRKPDQVVFALNEVFQSEMYGHKYFTIWYGVYQPSRRTLTWTGAGHHPAVLLAPGTPTPTPTPTLLPSSGPLIGALRGLEFPAETCTVEPGSRLIIFSDGVFEILRDERIVWSLDESIDLMSKWDPQRGPMMDALLAYVQELRGEHQLDDDFSIIEATFG